MRLTPEEMAAREIFASLAPEQAERARAQLEESARRSRARADRLAWGGPRQTPPKEGKPRVRALPPLPVKHEDRAHEDRSCAECGYVRDSWDCHALHGCADCMPEVPWCWVFRSTTPTATPTLPRNALATHAVSDPTPARKRRKYADRDPEETFHAQTEALLSAQRDGDGSYALRNLQALRRGAEAVQRAPMTASTRYAADMAAARWLTGGYDMSRICSACGLARSANGTCSCVPETAAPVLPLGVIE